MSQWDLDAVPASLLTYSNPKTAKGEGLGYLTAILHFAPARLSGANVCAYASAGCAAACLNTSGHGGIALDAQGLNSVQVARIRRTRFFRSDRDAFWTMLVREIRSHVRRSKRHGLAPAVRLNGTSDLPWERLPVTVDGEVFPNIMRAFPDVQFYDYTKFPRAKRGERKTGALAPNYSLTFSLAEDNDARAADALASGINVAVVFATRKGRALPGSFMGAPVVDGDLSDLRFLDPSGVIVGLRAKGAKGFADRSGFVRAA